MSVFNASRLLGKTVLITGASSGIGKVSSIQNARKDAAISSTAPFITDKATAILFAKVGVSPPQLLSVALKHTEQGGANVILTARRADALQNVAEQCAAAHRAAGVQQGGKFVSIALDVSDKNQIASFLEKIPTALRDVDVLGKQHHPHIHPPTHLNTAASIVNNAGYVVGVDRVGDLSLENMENMFTTNVFGLIALTQLFVKGMFSV